MAAITPPSNPLGGAILNPVRSALADVCVWAEVQPAWQRDALRRIYVGCGSASDDLEEFERMCRHQHGLLEEGESAAIPIPLSLEDVPTQPSSAAVVALKSVGRVQGVNALASDQILNFAATGLNVVYGDNGAGKSGYTRIVKRACRARDQEPILSNVYADPPAGPAEAAIAFYIAGAAQPSLGWKDGTPAPPDLSKISVFDSRCAVVHVDGKNDLAYIPAALQVLQALAQLCRDVNARLQARKGELEARVPSFRTKPISHLGTEVYRLVAGLTALTPLSMVRGLATLSDTEVQRLRDLKGSLAADAPKEIKRLQKLQTRLASVTALLDQAEGVLAPTRIPALRSLLRTAEEKEQAAHFAATAAFKDEPLPMVGSAIWKQLWQAARDFSTTEAYPSQPFPNVTQEAICVLCQQELSPAAAGRLTRFEHFVKANAEQAARAAKAAVTGWHNELQRLIPDRAALQDAVRLLADEIDAPLEAVLVARFLARAVVRGRKLIRASTTQALESFKPSALAKPVLSAFANRLDARLAEMERALDPNARTLQEKEARELEDRQWLGTILPDVAEEIERLCRVAKLDEAISDTDTKRLTRKVTEVAKSIVTDRLRDVFAAEIAALGIADRRVEFVQEKSGAGTTRFRVALIRNSRAKVGSVLSEGEHRCVALAAFLAELATADNRSCLIFDDPVSSLDHHYREAVAARLVREAAVRQVIVFTHDITFLLLLDLLASAGDLTPHYQTISRGADHAGFCTVGSPMKAQPVPEILNRLDRRLDQAEALFTQGRSDDWVEQVKAITGSLRDAWELAAEVAVSPVFRRYAHKVRTGGLRKLTVLTAGDCDEVKVGYAFCCTYSHTDPAEVNRPSPRPGQVRAEILRLRDWLSSIKARQEQIT